MAKTTDEKAFEKVVADLTKLGITKEAGAFDLPALTGSETLEELGDILDKAKAGKKAEEKSAKVAADEAGHAEATSRTFTLKSGQKRTFSPADHGDKWADSAAEFAVTHKANILSEA